MWLCHAGIFLFRFGSLLCPVFAMFRSLRRSFCWNPEILRFVDILLFKIGFGYTPVPSLFRPTCDRFLWRLGSAWVMLLSVQFFAEVPLSLCCLVWHATLGVISRFLLPPLPPLNAAAICLPDLPPRIQEPAKRLQSLPLAFTVDFGCTMSPRVPIPKRTGERNNRRIRFEIPISHGFLLGLGSRGSRV